MEQIWVSLVEWGNSSREFCKRLMFINANELYAHKLVMVLINKKESS